MITLPDKWMHFCGAFFFTKVLQKYFRKRTAILIVGSGSILLEVYQWFFQPSYSGKLVDSICDLIVDALGIWAGVSL